MKDVICPIDGRPCEMDCPDRYLEQPGGGCALTTAQELGAKIIDLAAVILECYLSRNSERRTNHE